MLVGFMKRSGKRNSWKVNLLLLFIFDCLRSRDTYMKNPRLSRADDWKKEESRVNFFKKDKPCYLDEEPAAELCG